MKSIILYHTKTGCTEKCATYVSEKNESEITKIIKFRGNLDEYENVVIMGPVYMGKIERTVTDFIKKFHDELLTKKLTIVIIAMNADGFKSMLKQNLSDEIREHAEIFHGGGAYYFERMTFFQKRIVQAVARVRTSSELILYENLDKIKI